MNRAPADALPAIAVFAGQKAAAHLTLPRRPFGLRWMFFMTLLALLVSAALFAASHFYIPLLIPFTISGLVFGLLYVRTNSLTAPTLAHCAHNTIAFIVTLWLWNLL